MLTDKDRNGNRVVAGLHLSRGQGEAGPALAPARISRNDEPTPVSDEEALQLIHSVKWYHRFELRPGLTTPGVSDFHPSACCDDMGIPKDLSGLRAVDIGAWDGPVSFELERRGARVVALDIQDPERVGFAVARRVLQSTVPHVQASVYDLPNLGLGLFDLVVFRGVYYHLKHPILAFERIAQSLKLGGRLYFEGEAALHYIEDLDGRRACVNLGSLEDQRVPACFSYPNRFKGGSNWFIPNLPCMEGWLSACGFKLLSVKKWESDVPPHGGQRMIGIADKVSEQAEQVEHPLY
jgi:tRNA (mo5U34)-methyltransferase